MDRRRPGGQGKAFHRHRPAVPEAPGTQIDTVTMEAVLTGRSFTLRWRELNDATRWLQGWR